MKKASAIEMIILLAISSLVASMRISQIHASPGTIRVPTDYPTIQGAVNAAHPGDVIYVYGGVYYEHVHVNQTVLLIGENRSSTIVDCGGSFGFMVVENDTGITGFTIRNSGAELYGVSVYAEVYGGSVHGFSFTNSGVLSSDGGVGLSHCYSSFISGNTIANNYRGINIRYGGLNTIVENTIAGNDEGISLSYSGNNSIYHNDFFNNSYHALTYEPYEPFDFWDDGYPSGGNHWGRWRNGTYPYGGTDLYHGLYQNITGSDGIGDTPYVIDEINLDDFPLMEPYDAGSTRYPWPMFRSDLRHGGYSEGSGPKTNQALWSYPTFSFVYSSPAVADGRVYVGSNDSSIRCLDALTGTSLWNYSTGGSIYSSPAVADGRVYVGSYDGNVYCLDALTGARLWNFLTGDILDSSPAVADGRVYVGSYDGNVYCLDALTGAYLWNFLTGHIVVSSPAVADGRVYVGSFDRSIYCLDALTGAYVWSYSTGGPVVSSPAVADGRVYVGSLDGKIYCLDVWTGTSVWIYLTGGLVYSSPAVADGRVCIGSHDRNISCLDALTGTRLWSYLTGDNVHSSPAVADGRVYTGSDDGNVYCLAASTGEQLWNYSTGNSVMSSPAIADGVLFVGSYDGRIYALGGVLRVPEDFRTIQEAIDAANPGDTISIAPSVYHEQLVINKPLTLVGRLGTSPIFAGGGSGTAVTLQPGASGTIIAGIIITSYNNGIVISGVGNCKIYGNIMSSMVSNGVAVEGSSAVNNNICSNIFQDNFNGISLVSSSTTNIFSDNIVASNHNVGINVESSGNTICSNTIMENQLGIRMAASGNTIYHNSFLNNPAQAATLPGQAPNAWDNDYPSGGNYWSDYTGVDVKSGSAQDVPGSDGIGDTAYTVSQNNLDRYPWRESFNPHDIGIVSLTPLRTVVAQGYCVNIEVRILNHGMHDETFIVECNANAIPVGSQLLTLLKRNAATITVVWNTAGLAMGDYAIGAYAGPVLDETDTSDNPMSDGTVTIAHLGDINADGKVDIKDIAPISAAFASLRVNNPADPKYGEYRHPTPCVTCPHSPNTDITNDDKVDIQDLARASANFGWHQP